MAINAQKYKEIIYELNDRATLVAVSKTKSVEDIQSMYNLGQRHFGENYVQELADKQTQLSKDIHWHFIGHLQSNKVKQIASFVFLIHGVDSLKLLQEINKQAGKLNKIISVLLQVHIAKEETKFGFDENELETIMNDNQLASLKNINVVGLMGMASFTDNKEIIGKEFHQLKLLFEKYNQLKIQNSKFTILSMGMSSDYKIAMNNGSNMVRIGSLLFGTRDYKT